MLRTLWEENRPALIALGALALALLSVVVVVPETEQAVVIRLGEPNRVINRFRPNVEFGKTGAGLTWRIPFFENMVRIDRRILSVDMSSQEVLSTDQLRLQVDAYARFRIIDPVKMVRTAGTTDRLKEQLQPILTSVLRQELGKRTFQSLLTADRGAAMIQIRAVWIRNRANMAPRSSTCGSSAPICPRARWKAPLPGCRPGANRRRRRSAPKASAMPRSSGQKPRHGHRKPMLMPSTRMPSSMISTGR